MKVKKALRQVLALRHSRWLRWSLLAGSVPMLFAIAGGLGLYLHPEWVKIESVQVELAPGSKEDLLFQRINTSLASHLQGFVGQYFWKVPLTAVFELTNKDRRVRRASVFREFPSRLRIVIEPHTPVLVYLSSDNRLYPVATDGTLLPAVQLNDASDLPILRGEDFKDDQRVRELALDLLEALPTNGVLRKKNLSEISHSAKDGFKIYLSGVNAEIRLGDADFGPRISRLEKVLAYLDNQNIKGRVIDTRFAKKVVVRVRNSP